MSITTVTRYAEVVDGKIVSIYPAHTKDLTHKERSGSLLPVHEEGAPPTAFQVVVRPDTIVLSDKVIVRRKNEYRPLADCKSMALGFITSKCHDTIMHLHADDDPSKMDFYQAQRKMAEEALAGGTHALECMTALALAKNATDVVAFCQRIVDISRAADVSTVLIRAIGVKYADLIKVASSSEEVDTIYTQFLVQLDQHVQAGQ